MPDELRLGLRVPAFTQGVEQAVMSAYSGRCGQVIPFDVGT
jgi:hypothetical protein